MYYVLCINCKYSSCIVYGKCYIALKYCWIHFMFWTMDIWSVTCKVNLVLENIPNKQIHIIQFIYLMKSAAAGILSLDVILLSLWVLFVQMKLRASDFQRKVSLLLYFATICAPITTTFTQNYHYPIHISFVHYNITIIKLPLCLWVCHSSWPMTKTIPVPVSGVSAAKIYIHQELVAHCTG